MLYGRKPIGTCAYMGGVPAVMEDFCWAWGQMIAYNSHYVCEPNESIHYDKATFSFHSWARNSLADRMLGDWLFMLDTDHKPEPDILARLLHRMNSHNLDVVTGLYQMKSAPHVPVLYGWHGEPDNENQVPLAGWGGDLIEIGGAGGGCLLVRRRVFDRIKTELHENPFDVIGQGGEDLAFFRRLRKLGITPFCDTRVECPHLTVKPVTMADFDPTALQGQTFRLDGKLEIKA